VDACRHYLCGFAFGLGTTLPEDRWPASAWVRHSAQHRYGVKSHIAIWLSGYYHGTRGDMTLDIQTLKANATKVEEYCLMKPEVLLIQAVKTVLGISY
jgi:HdeA/HdeB family